MPSRLELPQLLDCRGIQVEMGVKRATAEAIMRHLSKVEVPGLRKTYVHREDVVRVIKEWTKDR